jgi:DNA-directed RNA polymerase specialized sigma24 family protein
VIPLDTALGADEGDAPWMADEPGDRPEGLAMRDEIRRLMEARIDRLPDSYRTVFMLRAVQDRGHAAACRSHGAPGQERIAIRMRRAWIFQPAAVRL